MLECHFCPQEKCVTYTSRIPPCEVLHTTLFGMYALTKQVFRRVRYSGNNAETLSRYHGLRLGYVSTGMPKAKRSSITACTRRRCDGEPVLLPISGQVGSPNRLLQQASGREGALLFTTISKSRLGTLRSVSGHSSDLGG